MPSKMHAGFKVKLLLSQRKHFRDYASSACMHLEEIGDGRVMVVTFKMLDTRLTKEWIEGIYEQRAVINMFQSIS